MVLIKIIDLGNLHYKWACLPPHLVDKGTEGQTGKDPTMTTQITYISMNKNKGYIF